MDGDNVDGRAVEVFVEDGDVKVAATASGDEDVSRADAVLDGLGHVALPLLLGSRGVGLLHIVSVVIIVKSRDTLRC